MKKLSIVIILMLILVGCTKEYPGEYQLVCKSNRSQLRNEHFPETLELEWIQDTIMYAKDNFITGTQNKFEFILTDTLKEELEDKFSGDKEALLNEIIKDQVYNDFQWLDDAEEKKVEFLEDSIFITVEEESPPRPKGWKGLIVADMYNFSQVVDLMTNYEDHCEIIKD